MCLARKPREDCITAASRQALSVGSYITKPLFAWTHSERKEDNQMNEDVFNGSIRKFLKTLGVSAQREIKLSGRPWRKASSRATRSFPPPVRSRSAASAFHTRSKAKSSWNEEARFLSKAPLGGLVRLKGSIARFGKSDLGSSASNSRSPLSHSPFRGTDLACRTHRCPTRSRGIARTRCSCS